jgi:membrane-associated tyrosine/threonine-specific cdc2-inhibitory kinase
MDVKPDNIFITIDNPRKYKLGDFGIIVCLKENVIRRTLIAKIDMLFLILICFFTFQRDLSEFTEGDSRYLAPEVMQGIVTTKADVFSLGLTMLEISCHVDLPKGGSLWHQLRNGEFPEPTNYRKFFSD